jgi:hypothetical protein
VTQQSQLFSTVHLSWVSIAPDVTYVVQEATDPRSWESAAEVSRQTSTSADLLGRSPGTYFYRVRGESNIAASDWSNGVSVSVLSSEPWASARVPGQKGGGRDYSDADLVATHRATIRMCAARGDMLGVLSVPVHYREDDAIDHVTRLRSTQPGVLPESGLMVPPLDGDERTLSFGCMYHPWAVASPAGFPEDLRAVPPDGHAAGVLAHRSLLRGPWVAPANDPLTGVIALTPTASRANFPRLDSAHVNTLRQEARGFLWLSAATLSDDLDIDEIGVRRLLSLLRRLCLRTGPTYVFEPNSDAFRSRIRRVFEAILSDLLARGAFAGTTPADSFRVDTLDPPNTAATAEAGQLIVELKVAPSLPMRFLTVRLVNSGDQGITVEGI